MVEDDNDHKRFKEGQDGDHLMCPFQCDRCHFINIQGREPGALPKDALALTCICRANMDAFWARKSSTVAANRREGARAFDAATTLGLANPHPP